MDFSLQSLCRTSIYFKFRPCEIFPKSQLYGQWIAELEGGSCPRKISRTHQGVGMFPIQAQEVEPPTLLQTLPSWRQQFQCRCWNVYFLHLLVSSLICTKPENSSISRSWISCNIFNAVFCIGKSDIIANLTLGWWWQFKRGGFAGKLWRSFMTVTHSACSCGR